MNESIEKILTLFPDDHLDDAAKEAYASLLFIKLTVPSGNVWDHFNDEVKERAIRDYNYEYTENVSKKDKQ